MPDEKDNELADPDEMPASPLHAHTSGVEEDGEGREQDVIGDPEPDVRDEGDADDEQDPAIGDVGNPVDDDQEPDPGA